MKFQILRLFTKIETFFCFSVKVSGKNYFFQLRRQTDFFKKKPSDQRSLNFVTRFLATKNRIGLTSVWKYLKVRAVRRDKPATSGFSTAVTPDICILEDTNDFSH